MDTVVFAYIRQNAFSYNLRHAGKGKDLDDAVIAAPGIENCSPYGFLAVPADEVPQVGI